MINNVQGGKLDVYELNPRTILVYQLSLCMTLILSCPTFVFLLRKSFTFLGLSNLLTGLSLYNESYDRCSLTQRM
jgi:hypothetical protein